MTTLNIRCSALSDIWPAAAAREDPRRSGSRLAAWEALVRGECRANADRLAGRVGVRDRELRARGAAQRLTALPRPHGQQHALASAPTSDLQARPCDFANRAAHRPSVAGSGMGELDRDCRIDPPARAGCCLCCLLYTSDAADEEDSVDLGGRRI